MATMDVYPGKDLGTLELTITDEMVHHYIKGLDEPNPWYTAASPFGGPVAPVIIYQQADSEFKGWYLDNLFGNLWRRQEWEIHAPTHVGQVGQKFVLSPRPGRVTDVAGRHRGRHDQL